MPQDFMRMCIRAVVVVLLLLTAVVINCNQLSAQGMKIGSRVIDGTLNYCADAGSTDDYACSLSPAITTYITGACYTFKANSANIGAATINLNSIGQKTIKKTTSGVTTDLSTNDIRVGQLVNICYDGTNMQMQSVRGNEATGGGAGTVTNVSGSTNEISVANGTSTPVISLATQIDLSGKTWVKPFKTGTSLPATCSVGDMYFKSDASAGVNLYGCTSTNTWTLQGDGGGGGGGTPGGSSGQIQYNNGGAFGGYSLSTGLEVSSSNLRVNTTTVAPMPLYGSAAIDFSSISGQTCATSTVTVTGANAGDPAYLQLPSGFSGDLNANVRISATDTATIKVCNPTSGSIDPASGTFGVIVQKLTWTVGTVYNVGPGKTYTTIASVPWDSLNPGDEVRIHYKSGGYKEKWHIGRSGTFSAPIRVVGVRGPLNERPLIDGNQAVAKTGQSYWNEDRGVIKIGGPVLGGTRVRHVVIEGLDIRNARFGNTFTGTNGVVGNPYLDNAAAIYVEGPADFITIRDNYIYNNGDGLFLAGGITFPIIEGNHLYLNGYSGSSQQHNSYIQAYGALYQFNRYELNENWEGNNLKDRGAATVVRYNQMIDGNRCFDLINGAEQVTYGFPYDYIYGNLFIKRRGYNNNQVLHYGWDTDSSQSRRNFYLYHNTFVITRQSPGEAQFVVIKVDHASTTAYAYNNAITYYSPTGEINAYYGGDLTQGPGLVTWVNNWIYQGDCSNPSLTCTRQGSGYVDGGSNIWAGSANAYVDNTTGAITNAASPLIGAAGAIPNYIPPIRAQYPLGTLRTDINEIGALAY